MFPVETDQEELQSYDIITTNENQLEPSMWLLIGCGVSKEVRL